MTTQLAHQRCRNHAEREAIARCPECKRFFCRECVLEHDDRMICTSCLAALSTKAPAKKRSTLRFLLKGGQLAVSVLLAWFFFYLFGKSLVSLPSSFHEVSIWKTSTMEEE